MKSRVKVKHILKIMVAIIFLFLFFNNTKIYGMAKKKLLIYGFRNLVQSTDNKNLDIKLSIFMYDKISCIKKNKYRVFIADNNIDKNYRFITDEDYLYEVAKEKGFKLVLYGFYNIENERLRIFPKLLLVDRKIIVDVNKIYPSIYSIVREAEEFGVKNLINYKNKKKLKIVHINYRQKEEITVNKVIEKLPNKQRSNVFHLPIMLEISSYGGVIFPTDVWDMLYSSGFFTNIDVSFLSKKSFFPISLTVQSRYSVFNMKSENGEYIDSDLNMFYMGLGLDYNFHLVKFIRVIRVSVSGGFTNTLLLINNKSFESTDPTADLSINMIFKLNERMKLKLGIGGFFISYVDSPFTAFYVSTGIIFGK